ncbi:MAG: tripartite tricarboxylate transporter substrate binding protein [Betaproteobacteria bacterium]|nr:tripartite tricarboxylate transporter substrate binding protein [Betaproteobacteria bacterium]
MAFRKLLFLAALFSSVHAFAADWPAKPLHFIVPYPPGGGTDVVARLVAAKVGDSLKQPVVVENRVGANGAIATDYVVKAPPDGYTVLFDAQSAAITPAISRVAYDPVKDLQPLAKLVTQAFVIAATPSLPAKNLRELVQVANARPQGLNAAAPGSATYLAGELFKLTTGAKMTFIPYKGGAPATLAIMSGETDIGFMDVPSVATQILAVRIKALAVTTPRRVKLLPAVPTSAEAGMPEFAVEGWLGSFLPAHAAPEIVERLNREVNAALGAPEVVAKVEQIGGEPVRESAAQFTRYFHDEVARWKDVVVRAKVKVE